MLVLCPCSSGHMKSSVTTVARWSLGISMERRHGRKPILQRWATPATELQPHASRVQSSRRAPETAFVASAGAHDFVKEFADKHINILLESGGDKLPYCGVVLGNHATSVPAPRVLVRKLGIK